MKLEAWLAWKLLFTKQVLRTSSHLFAFVGLVLGVAILISAMAVMSGFESSLQRAISDVSGHIQVVKRNYINDSADKLKQKINTMTDQVQAAQSFALVESVLPANGKILGVLIEGIESEKYQNVLQLNQRVLEGELNIFQNKALIGRGVAKNLGLKVGDQFKVVIPVADGSDISKFERFIGEFQVSAIMDYGKNEWNQRSIIVDIQYLQKVARIGDRYTGLLIKLKDMNQSKQVALNLSEQLGAGFWAKDWREQNENLLQAVAIERVAVFFVVMVILIVAAFNFASSLYVNVMQRYTEIAILKSVGLPRKSLIRVFYIQSFIVAAIAIFLGFILGLGLSYGFEFIQQTMQIMDGSVYKLDSIKADIRLIDILSVGFATIFVCLIATVLPAQKGADLSPVEGLRYG